MSSGFDLLDAIDTPPAWTALSKKTIRSWQRLVRGTLYPPRLAAIQQDVPEEVVRRLMSSGQVTTACDARTKRLLVDVEDVRRHAESAVIDPGPGTA